MINDLPYGLECNDGWAEIIENTHRKLEYLDPNYKVDQIKEKFGGLRYYFTPSVPHDSIVVKIMHDVVRMAEYEASNTCEMCGANKNSDNVETRVHKYWYYTYCEPCSNKYVAEREARWKEYDADNSS